MNDPTLLSDAVSFARKLAFLWAAYPPEDRWEARRMEAEAIVRRYEKLERATLNTEATE